MIIGLHFNSKQGDNTRFAWQWLNGLEPTAELWESKPPSSGYDRYGCINVNTKKIKTFPVNLMKYVICEYSYGKLQ